MLQIPKNHPENTLWGALPLLLLLMRAPQNPESAEMAILVLCSLGVFPNIAKSPRLRYCQIPDPRFGENPENQMNRYPTFPIFSFLSFWLFLDFPKSAKSGNLLKYHYFAVFTRVSSILTGMQILQSSNITQITRITQNTHSARWCK